jgi:uncharacterized protein YndB with AHSA1/START domain
VSVDQTENVVAVTRRIDAPADSIFTMLCDPAAHVSIDGSTMLRSSSAKPVSRVGDRFAMEMWNDEMGSYEMTNTVVELEPDRRIRWEPVLTRASRPQDADGVGESAKQLWGYELTPIDGNATEATATFDCRESPAWLKQAVRGGERWVASMTATLDNLAKEVERAGGGRPPR